MARIEWDQPGEKKFQTGVDRGVLYLPNAVVAWNGLTGVEENFNTKSQPYYQDGIKYMDYQVLSDFSATLKAFTYPDEFDQCVGIRLNINGVSVHDQLGEPFGLSYRTLLGDDISGLDHGYIIHVLRNLRAIPSSNAHSSLGGNVTPMEFSWVLTSTPENIPWRRSTAHVSIRSTYHDATRLAGFEDILYGSASSPPHLPTFAELVSI